LRNIQKAPKEMHLSFVLSLMLLASTYIEKNSFIYFLTMMYFFKYKIRA